MEKYVAQITHNNGSITIFVAARNIEQAKKAIMEMEGCPECAIKIEKTA